MNASPSSPARVLLVDDSPANLIALEAVLKPLGLDLVLARSGAEALEKAAEGSFAVALLDVQMPDIDGFEVASRIRATASGKEMPIIFLTAIHRDERYARKGYASGAADYITKPYDPEVLRARVKAFADLFRQREELRAHDVEVRTRERDEAIRRLVAFERISSAALEEGGLTSLLPKLLGVFLEAADSADSATILLREGDVMRVRASVGRTAEKVGRTVPMGVGLAGVIAATGEPFLLNDASAVRAGVRSLFGVPLMNDGSVIGVTQIGSTRTDDFSDVEKRLLRALAERAAWAVAQRFRVDRFYEMLMTAPAIVSIVRGPDLECEFSNVAHRQLYGGRDVLGVPASSLGATPEILAMFERARVTGQPIAASEYPIFCDWRADGKRERRFFTFTLEPMRGPTGKIEEILWFAIDVTDQVLTREAVERASRERARLLESERTARTDAEIANRAKDDFLATVSHELRTPLNAILGWTVVARRQAPKELERALGIIERNARAQTRIIEDVLDVSRIVGGKLRLDIAGADVAAAIEGALETVRPEAEARGVVLSADVGAVGIIAADADRLQQVVWNVLSNAIKFTPEGGNVDLAAARLGQRIVIRVTDTGEGIDAAFLPHLFEPFRQADGSTTRRHGGLGLGLAIVKQLVQAHGGTIRAESEGLRRGSTFTIELPARSLPAVAMQGDSAENPSAPKHADGRLHHLRLLVVDDEEDARSLLEEILSESGATVMCASGAQEALEMVEEFQPDVLISDVGMPDIDGFELIEQLRRLPSEQGGRIPAIALTAYARGEDLERAAAAGFERHVMKPVDPASLVSAVASLVGRSSRRPPAPTSGVGQSS
ncbi:MAG TPA: response regulator [Polyangiaceae bacterium]|jgi:signal transduction histidine kinase/DNA-binding response OmpR family regulator|nr:response regulator [Polyangiaceae bacterium]